MYLNFKHFLEAILQPDILKVRKYNDFNKLYLSYDASVKIDNQGHIVFSKPEGQYFTIRPRNRILELHRISPQSVDFRRLVIALRQKYHDIDNWEVNVYKQAGHMETGREPHKNERSVGYWMGQGAINFNNKLPKYVYHGTSSNLWYESIKKNGLLPRSMSGSSGGYGSQNIEALSVADVVYLSTHPDAAARSAARQTARMHGGRPIILRIATSGLSPDKFTTDEDSGGKDAQSSVRTMSTFGYKGKIPPSIIEPFLIGEEKSTKSRLFSSWEKFKDVSVGEHPLTTQLKDGRTPYNTDASYYALLDAGIIGPEKYKDASGWENTRTVIKKPINDEEIKRIIKSAGWANNVKAILKDLNDGYSGSLYRLKEKNPDDVKKKNSKLFNMLVDSGLVSVESYQNRKYLTVNSWNPEDRAIKFAKLLGNKDFRVVKKDIEDMTNIDKE